MIVAPIVAADSKLATTRWWQTTSLTTSPAVDAANEDRLHAAMDWLLDRQSRIERALAKRHLQQEGGLVLYDLSSSYVEGSCCPLAAFGHNRDAKEGRQQITTACSSTPRAARSASRSTRATPATPPPLPISATNSGGNIASATWSSPATAAC
jgi:hypothetical protein